MAARVRIPAQRTSGLVSLPGQSPVKMTKNKVTLAGVGIAVVLPLLWIAHRNPNPLPPEVRADRVIVEKSARRLILFRGSTPLKTYTVALGRAPVGPKQQEGDKRTPEGSYTIDRRKDRSSFHRALHISYPTPQQSAAAAARGVTAGGDIMIHGLRNGFGWIGAFHRIADWTAGCIAVTDAEIEEICRAVPDGTPIDIVR